MCDTQSQQIGEWHTMEEKMQNKKWLSRSYEVEKRLERQLLHSGREGLGYWCSDQATLHSHSCSPALSKASLCTVTQFSFPDSLAGQLL